MGFKFEFNTIVKENDPERLVEMLEALDEGDDVAWSKPEARLYPLGVPLDLTDAQYRALTRVEVVELRVRQDRTWLRLRLCGGSVPSHAAAGMGCRLGFHPAIHEEDDKLLEDLVQRMDEGDEEEWFCSGAHVYPLAVPLDLVDRHGRRLASVEVTELRVRRDRTRLLMRLWRG